MTTTVDEVTCRAGLHPWPDSRYVSPAGHTYCRECDRVRSRRHRAPSLPATPLMPNLPGAACVDHPDLPWVPDVGTSRGPIRLMRAICQACPVIDACREYALSDHELHGVWGGLAWSERRAVWEAGR